MTPLGVRLKMAASPSRVWNTSLKCFSAFKTVNRVIYLTMNYKLTSYKLSSNSVWTFYVPGILNGEFKKIMKCPRTCCLKPYVKIILRRIVQESKDSYFVHEDEHCAHYCAKAENLTLKLNYFCTKVTFDANLDDLWSTNMKCLERSSGLSLYVSSHCVVHVSTVSKTTAAPFRKRVGRHRDPSDRRTD